MSREDIVFQSGELTIKVTAAPDGSSTIAWFGTSDAQKPGLELNPFLTQVAENLAGSAVVVDFRTLEYMNSATVSTIIHFARALDTHRVAAKLLYDASIGWQRVNFVCMKGIAKTLTHVEVVG